MSSSLPPSIELTNTQQEQLQAAIQNGWPAVASPYAHKPEAKTVLHCWEASQHNRSKVHYHWIDEFVVYAPAHWKLEQLNALLAETGQGLGMAYPPHWSLAQVLAYAPIALNEGWARPLRQNLLGLHWLDATATVIGAGGRVLKNVTGYDLHRFHLGLQGTLGLPVGVCLRTRPLSEFPLRRFACNDVKTFMATYRQLNAAPPEALYGMYLDNGSCQLLWQGSDALLMACLPFGSFRDEGIERAAYYPATEQTLILTFKGMDEALLLEEWEALWQRFPMFQFRWNLACHEVSVSSLLHQSVIDNATLTNLFQWVKALKKRHPALVVCYWNTSADVATCQWRHQLSPQLWKQWQAVRQAWGIQPHMFPSPYITEHALIEAGILSTRLKGGHIT